MDLRSPWKEPLPPPPPPPAAASAATLGSEHTAVTLCTVHTTTTYNTQKYWQKHLSSDPRLYTRHCRVFPVKVVFCSYRNKMALLWEGAFNIFLLWILSM